MSSNDGNPNAVCPECHQVRLGSINPKKPDECINCGANLAGIELPEYKPPKAAMAICSACGTLQGAADYKTCSKCGMSPAAAKEHVATLTAKATAPAEEGEAPKRRRRA